ncbi:uncharacterized protein LOC111250339 isoform X3 [Varroa destructor]|uniref:Uncharacterized protein n=1 Tax=Varroa destructor TaxID=109461 RepID=A0A7M7K420_VARDE|nr:uncharacterized protein LOC111250339 isoform X3 [Varroa destructor]
MWAVLSCHKKLLKSLGYQWRHVGQHRFFLMGHRHVAAREVSIAKKDGLQLSNNVQMVYKSTYQTYLNISAFAAAFLCCNVFVRVLQYLEIDVATPMRNCLIQFYEILPTEYIQNSPHQKKNKAKKLKDFTETEKKLAEVFFMCMIIVFVFFNKMCPVRMYYDHKQKMYTLVHISPLIPFVSSVEYGPRFHLEAFIQLGSFFRTQEFEVSYGRNR